MMNKFWLFFLSIRWQDIVDILLNSYILFRLYVLFRGTNALRVFIGIAFLLFFQRIAFLIGLTLTSWAIQGITGVAALIIIVIFRNEIRSVFQTKNFKTVFWGTPQKTVSTPVEIIADSVYEMAQKHIGALIVFPGKEDLKELVQSGLPWQGLISKEMLTSIFWHDNPVHDGAIIIQDDRVTQVGVILPLSQQKNLPSSFGTRHRAAVGMAENSDALVIVVSEEKGNVVVAYGSKIIEVKQKKALERRIQKHIGVRISKKNDSGKERFSLGIAALVCVLFVTWVWFTITRGLDTMTSFEVPVEYMNRNPEMEIVDTSINKARLHLSGPDILIKSIRPEQVRVKLDMSNAVAGPNTFAFNAENITLPPGIVLKKIEPSVVDVTLDMIITKEVPIQVDWAGKLNKSLILTNIKLDANRIQLTGSRLALENISTLYTEKVFLDQIDKSGLITVKLLIDSSLKIAQGFQDTVTVTYTVKEREQKSVK
ncbi:MAG: DNA integrity scanning protein DisA nucleotide-binding domain protein [Deltaproteobacteria bacterium]|nr:DNA integrity scanning protein DisA nucleotide-binding domain protein [Deltaproteobacteria bacterium]